MLGLEFFVYNVRTTHFFFSFFFLLCRSKVNERLDFFAAQIWSTYAISQIIHPSFFSIALKYRWWIHEHRPGVRDALARRGGLLSHGLGVGRGWGKAGVESDEGCCAGGYFAPHVGPDGVVVDQEQDVTGLTFLWRESGSFWSVPSPRTTLLCVRRCSCARPFLRTQARTACNGERTNKTSSCGHMFELERAYEPLAMDRARRPGSKCLRGLGVGRYDKCWLVQEKMFYSFC